MQVVALIVLVSSLSISSVLSIHCYDCNSKMDQQCADPFTRFPLSLLNCDEKPMVINNTQVPATFCRKQYQNVYGEVRIIRSCGYLREPNSPYRCRRDGGQSKGVNSISCECNEDLCNGSNKTQASLIVSILMAICIVSRMVFN